MKMALSEARVSSEPEIFYGRNVNARQPAPACQCNNNNTCSCIGDEARGDIAAHGFWKRGRTAIFDIRICDTDAKSYGNTSSAKVLAQAEKEKKRKYEAACLERRRDFTPLVYSVDGMPGKEARATEKRIASLLATKWDRQYSEMAAFVRTRMSLAVVRANTLLLRGDRSHHWRRTGAESGSDVAASRSVDL